MTITESQHCDGLAEMNLCEFLLLLLVVVVVGGARE